MLLKLLKMHVICQHEKQRVKFNINNNIQDISVTVTWHFFLSDVIKSAIGFLIWFAGLTAWILIYQKYRASWGEIGDKISFVIPLGEP